MDNTGDYVQCTKCGHIYKVEEKHSSKTVYIDSICPKCGNKKGLCCFDDVYKYYDPFLDRRYF